MPKAIKDVKISFFGLELCCYFNLIAFIISVETEALLLALAKSLYYNCAEMDLRTPYISIFSLCRPF